MSDQTENLVRPERRIVCVSKWKNPNCDSHLRNIYQKKDDGYFNSFLNFFTDTSDVMTVANAQNHLNWVKPIRKQKNLNRYTTLCVYPVDDFYWSMGQTEAERKILFREAIKQSMSQIIKKTELSLNWVAAVSAKSWKFVGMIVISKRIFDEYMFRFREIDECFPKQFFRRRKDIDNNLSYVEKTIATAFFTEIEENGNFVLKKKELIEMAHKYKFVLPISYYDHLQLDEENLLDI